MNTAEAKLPWHGMANTTNMNKKTRTACPHSTVNWLTKWATIISVVVTPVKAIRLILKTKKFIISAVDAQITGHKTAVQQTLLPLANEDGGRHRHRNEEHDPAIAKTHNKSNVSHISNRRESTPNWLDRSAINYRKEKVSKAISLLMQNRSNQTYVEIASHSAIASEGC